jgi:hypothetical protein
MCRKALCDRDPEMNHARARQFLKIVRHYAGIYEELERSGAAPYRLTARGAWAASRACHVFYFFKGIRLDNFASFCDLGSGDGIVTCIAGLFTPAVGIEADEYLCRVAKAAAGSLDLQEKVSQLCADYLTQNLSQIDCLYLYPDKPFHALEAYLLDSGWRGTLLVYGPHLPPHHLKARRHLKCGKERMTVYGVPSVRGI